MSLITIPGYLEENGTTYYEVNIKLPLRSITVHKRYTDFVLLANALSKELGLSASDFPYLLPGKLSFFASKKTIAEQRKSQLCSFLLNVVKDRDLQNRVVVHRFLQLPQNFKFTRDLFEESSDTQKNDEKFLIDDSETLIDKDQWLSYFRIVKSNVSKLDKNTAVTAQAESRVKIQNYIRPNVERLASSLTHLYKSGAIDKAELNSRTTRLTQLQNDIESVLANKDEVARASTRDIRPVGRVFGKPDNGVAKETNDTIGLNNQELLLQQQQIHQQQDQEVEQLRKIIARQRQIGQAIHSEVEEQNEMLDRFSEEVDYSADKLQNARNRAKRIA